MENCTVPVHEQRIDKLIPVVINPFDVLNDDDNETEVVVVTTCVRIQEAWSVDVVNLTAHFQNRSVLEGSSEVTCNVSERIYQSNGNTLFYSEYLEGSSAADHYLEIYNPTCLPFDMSTVEFW